MAADALGHEIQGAMGAEDELTSAEIAEADAVVIAADTSVSRDRFEGKPVVKSAVAKAINEAEALLQEAESKAKSGATTESESDHSTDAESEDETTTETETTHETHAIGRARASSASSNRCSPDRTIRIQTSMTDDDYRSTCIITMASKPGVGDK